MKKITILVTCLSLIVSVSFAQPAKSKANPLEDTIQYTLGVYMVQQLLAKTGYVVNNPILFKKAIDDVMQGKKLMINPASAESRLLAYQEIYRQERGRQLEAALFAKVRKEPGFVSLPNGVAYSMVKQGQGIRPTAKDTVILNIISQLADGTVIDDTNKSKLSFMALTADMLPGLKEVLYKMQEGAVCRAILPAATAYGTAGTATIPPNSALIYDIALVSVRPGK